MKKIAGFVRALILILLGIYVISLSIFITVVCFYGCFFKNVIKIYEYVAILAFIIFYIILYLFIFRYFMLQKVYNIKNMGKQNIMLNTQFKEIYIKKDDILSKSISYFKSYRIRVKIYKKIKTFYISYKLIDLLK